MVFGESTQSIHSQLWVADGMKTTISSVRRLIGGRYEVRAFGRLAELRTALGEAPPPAMLVAAVDLPDGCIFDMLREPARIAFPFVLIARDPSPEVIAQSLQFGAQDFFLKPLHPHLFGVKLEHLIRQHCAKRSSPLDLHFDFQSLSIHSGKATVRLTFTEFKVLHILNEVLPGGASRMELNDKIWKETKVVRKTLDAHIFKLRRKLEPLGLQITFGTDRKFSVSAAPAAAKSRQ